VDMEQRWNNGLGGGGVWRIRVNSAVVPIHASRIEYHMKLSKTEHKAKEPVSNCLSYGMATAAVAAC
jgi:hypothetical protein